MTILAAFPDGFLWGTASSSYQVEGDNRNSQWWRFEQQPGAITGDQRSGLACDWWRDAEQDFDRMAELRLSACRLSVEWSRVEPAPGRFDAAALDRYRQMLAALHARGIAPWVALHHFSNPLWFEQAGGWESSAAVKRWLPYVHAVISALGDLCADWLTFNEPLVYLGQGWIRGRWPPRKQSPRAALSVFRNLLKAHALAYHAIHDLCPSAHVGCAKALRMVQPLRASSPGDRFAAWLRRYLFDELWLQATTNGALYPPLGFGHGDALLRNTCDFLGVNYYCRLWTRFSPDPRLLFGREQFKDNAETSDCGSRGPYSQFDPYGLSAICMDLRRYRIPIYVLENGLPDADDDQRPRWLLAHLLSLHRAIRAGADVRGYFHWTLIDNFEWDEGWNLRFGLFELDPRTQQRRPRPSAALYRQIAESNVITASLLEQVAPSLLA